MPSSSIIDTALDATTPPLLLDPMADSNAGTTAVQVRRTIYVPPPFNQILLSGKLSPVEDWQRLWGALVAQNLEADCWAVVDWLQFALVHDVPNLSPNC